MSEIVEALNTALDGRYRIERQLGEGGMATVYLTRDLRHERSVALKVLKPELAAIVGAERFLAEIKTTANLQHPHILPLHDSGEAAGFLYYVMPYIEGESLRGRLGREHQLSVDEAVRIAVQVAGALQYAHAEGVIHRDIKPANILLSRGEAVVADFGIALAVSAAGGGRLTETGLSLGTPHYMSPEQATGESAVGPATDIYALGCVLYEMLVGDPPYTGSTAQAVLGKIISGEPEPITAQRKSVPANVSAVVTKALEKVPADRFGGAADFARALGDANFTHRTDIALAAATSGRRWRTLSFAATGTALVLALALVWVVTRPQPSLPVAQFEYPFREGQEPYGTGPHMFNMSSDGSFVVYQGPNVNADQGRALWIRRWAELDAAPIPGSDGGLQPAISTDNRQVAFRHLGEIKVVPVEGGATRTLIEGQWPKWGPDGMIYASVADGIVRVPASGGAPESVMELAAGEASVIVASFLQRGVALVHVHFADGAASEIRALQLESGAMTTLTPGTWPRYAASGHLTFISADGWLMASPFDPGALELTGPPVRVVEGVAAYALSKTGHLLYTTTVASGAVDDTELVWMTRSGEVTPVDSGWQFDRGGISFGWRISPDETRIALVEQTGINLDVWIKELPAGAVRRLTFDDERQWAPWWTPDGQTVTYLSGQESNVWSQNADGTGEATRLVEDGPFAQGLWDPTAEWLVLRTSGGITTGAQGIRDIVAIRPAVDTAILPLLATENAEYAPALSPDGRWLAYQSNETGRSEIFVRPFPDVDGGKVPVSTGGGAGPRWARNGQELFFMRGYDLIVARLETEPQFRVLNRTTLLEIPSDFISVGSASWVSGNNFYDVTADGQRFLMGRALPAPEPAARSTYILVQNFNEVLKERAGN